MHFTLSPDKNLKEFTSYRCISFEGLDSLLESVLGCYNFFQMFEINIFMLWWNIDSICFKFNSLGMENLNYSLDNILSVVTKECWADLG